MQKYSNAAKPEVKKHNVSINSEDFIDEDEDPGMLEAIMASLLKPDQNDGSSYERFDPKAQEEERRLLLEIMQISRLEDQKKKGNINLDHLKRNRKQN